MEEVLLERSTACRQVVLDKFQEASQSPKKLALLRIESLNSDGDGDGDGDGEDGCSGLAGEIVSFVLERFAFWTSDASKANHHESTDDESFAQLLQILAIVVSITVFDATLSEEIARYPAFCRCISSLQQQLPDDAVVQKAAADIQAFFSTLEELDPDADLRVPFTEVELQGRLPLVFGMPQQQQNQTDNQLMEILIHQVTSEKETDTHDVGFVMWPSSVLLSRYIVDHPSIVLDSGVSGGDSMILELGAGCGLVGLTAATLLKQSGNETRVIFSDYLDQILDNLKRNIRLNNLDDSDRAAVTGLDFFDQPGNDDSVCDSPLCWIDMDGTKQPQVSLVLAADVICYSNDATNVANTIKAALIPGGKAIVVSKCCRFGVEEFPDACRDAGLEIEITNIAADGGRSSSGSSDDNEDQLLVHDLEQTSGYALGYNLVMFTINKPMLL
mmetsp:Transcript_37948/g.82545  ORF Transcript_37948/g.82545 Transcript_37948/m.82545 type:complete len:444 (+) Transcript_37948:230-1561(+)